MDLHSRVQLPSGAAIFSKTMSSNSPISRVIIQTKWSSRGRSAAPDRRDANEPLGDLPQKQCRCHGLLRDVMKQRNECICPAVQELSRENGPQAGGEFILLGL